MFYIYYYLRDKDSKIANRGTPYYVGKGHGKRCYSKDHRIKVPEDTRNIVKVIENIQDEEINFEQDLDGDGSIGFSASSLNDVETDTTGYLLKRDDFKSYLKFF